MIFKQNRRRAYKKDWDVLRWIHAWLGQYFEGTLKKEEKSFLDAWDPVNNVAMGQEDAERVERIASIAKRHIFRRLGIPLPEVPFAGEAACRERQKPTLGKPLFALRPFIQKYAVAAVFVGIVLSIGAGFFLRRNAVDRRAMTYAEQPSTCFKTADREKRKMTLPDGSTVYLNGGTTLSIRKSTFNHHQREVWLEEGEAFFDVVRNPSKPFIVHSGALSTVVKGTSFNVKAYRELEESSVTVRTGRVEVNALEKRLSVLTPNRQLVYHKQSRKYEECIISSDDATAWQENRLVLRKATTSELKLRMRQLYGIELVVEGTALSGKYTSSSFPEKASLESVMESICLLHGVHYQIDGQGKVFVYQ
jgi:transmembrane sensor